MQESVLDQDISWTLYQDFYYSIAKLLHVLKSILLLEKQTSINTNALSLIVIIMVEYNSKNVYKKFNSSSKQYSPFKKIIIKGALTTKWN